MNNDFIYNDDFDCQIQPEELMCDNPIDEIWDEDEFEAESERMMEWAMDGEDFGTAEIDEADFDLSVEYEDLYGGEDDNDFDMC